MTALHLRRLLAGGAITVAATLAVPTATLATPPPTQGCSDTLVVVEWRDAPNSPPADKGISGGCGAADPNPIDVLQHAGFSPMFETLTSKILCAIYLSPGAQCKGMPTNAYWSYWVVNPQSHDWEEQSYDTGDTTPTSPHPAPNAVHPAAAAAAPPVEDWVYQSDHVAGKPDVPPAYPASGTPPTSSPTSPPASYAPSTAPTTRPARTGAPAPTVRITSERPSLPPTARLPQVRHTATASHTDSSPSPDHTAATTSALSDGADGDYVAAPPIAPSTSDPNLPGAPIPGTWALSPSGQPPTDLAQAGRASKAAWATGDSAHRVAWSTGLGIAAAALLGVGVAAQLRRRRT